MRWITVMSATALTGMLCLIAGCGQGPQSASAETTDAASSENPLAPFIAQAAGGFLDLNDLRVGDRLVIDVRPQANATFLSNNANNDCICNWMINPTVSGSIETSDSCLATLTVNTDGPADLAVVRRCGTEIETFAQQILVSSLGIAVAASDKVVADAGSDITVREGAFVTINGSRSQGPDRAPLTYTWNQIAGPPVNLSSVDTTNPSFQAPLTDTPFGITFALTISDGQRSDTDQVTIHVTPLIEAVGDLAADAGPDQTVAPGSDVILEGSISRLSGGNVRYAWTQVAGPTVTVRDGDAERATFTAPQIDESSVVLVFEFTARTATAVALDETRITIESAFDPASLDVTFEEGDELTDADDQTNDNDDPSDSDDDDDDMPESSEAPVVVDAEFITSVGTPIPILLRTSPVGGPAEQFRIDVDPCNGQVSTPTTVSPTTGRVMYLPDPGFRGVDRFNFVAFNNTGVSTEATVTVTVGSPRNMRAIWANEDIDDLVDANGNGVLPELLDRGVKDFIIKLNLFDDPIHWSTRLRLEKWAAYLRDTDAKLWPIFNFYAANDTGLTPYLEPYVNSDGQTLANTPCPTDVVFWRRAVTKRMLHLVDLAGFNPNYDEPVPHLNDVVGGILFDVELYASEVRRWDTPCYCDQCFASFVAAQGITGAVPIDAAARHPFLVANGLDDDYEDFEQNAIRELAAATREAVHAINPCITIGGTALVRELTHYRGISQGLGSKRKPFVELSQQQFFDGYNDAVPAMQAFIEAQNIHADLVPGLWFRFFPPTNLQDHFYTAAVETEGVWLNRTSSFEHPGELCHDADEYYAAIGFANDELERFEANPNHVSPLDAAPFAPACFEQEPYETDPTLMQLEPGPAVQTGMWIRKETAYLLDASVGETIAMDVEFRRIGSSDFGDGWWILLDPEGQQVASGALAEAQIGHVDHAVTTTGIHTLVVNASFVHAFRINNASHPGSYQRTGDNPRVNTWKGIFIDEPQLYAYMQDGETQFRISVEAAGGEPTQVIVRDARQPGNHLFDEIVGDITGGDELIERDITLPIANPNGTVLEVILRNPGGADDLEIRIDGGALPYISQTRSGLLQYR